MSCEKCDRPYPAMHYPWECESRCPATGELHRDMQRVKTWEAGNPGIVSFSTNTGWYQANCTGCRQQWTVDSSG